MVAPIPAAQYLRISTEEQQYSILNQETTIARYAQDHGLQIVKTYKDEGKSGLALRFRDGLKRLLEDVMDRRCEFRSILVYDISRWGRFQNVDEAAHYEFICTQAGLPIHYCAEQFANDGTLPSAILKALKRTMAAEYSRELSVRTYAGLMRAVREGWHVGSGPGYGFRRMLCSADGSPKQILRDGEQKSLRTDRVKLVLGPQEEIKTVRLIYRMFLNDGLCPTEIARELARRGISCQGRPWSFYAVKHVLTHPKYCGIQAWGRTESKLQTQPRRVPKQQWITNATRGPAIIDEQKFARAQRLYFDRTDHKTDTQLLNSLRKLWRQESFLTADLIDISRMTATVNTYRHRFGNLRRAFQLIGYTQSKTRIRRKVERSRRNYGKLRQRVIRLLLRVSSGFIVQGHYQGCLHCPQIARDIIVAICRAEKFRNGRSWYISPRRDQASAITLLCLLNDANTDVGAFYVVPPFEARRHEFKIRPGSKFLMRGTKLRSPRGFCRAVLEVHRQNPCLEQANRPLIGVPQISRYLKVSPHVVRRLVRHGLPVVREGHCPRAYPSQVDEWVREHGIAWTPQRDRLGRFLPRQKVGSIYKAYVLTAADLLNMGH